MKNLLLTQDEIEFLKNVTEEHIKEVEKTHDNQEHLIEYLSEEKYKKFLENLMKKLKTWISFQA